MKNNENCFVVTKIEIEKKQKNSCTEIDTTECDNYDIKYKISLIEQEYIETTICDSYYCLINGTDIKCKNVIYDDTIDFEEDYDCICDKDLAIAIYKKLKINHPNINSNLIIKYMNAALFNMRTKEKTENAQKKRIKRLGLNPKFNNWSIESTIQYK